MIINIKPYPAMKDSSIEWLGEVPAHWDVRRLKADVANVVEQTAVGGEDDLYVALEHVESWTGRILTDVTDAAFDSQVKKFKAGDVLFGKLRPYLAKVARPARSGVCVGEFLVLRPRNGKQSAAYLELFLRSKPIIDAINASTFGAKMPRADWTFIGGLDQLIPPLDEQRGIVRYLDWVGRRVGRFVGAKEKLVGLLTEQKQGIIHRAVTRGLNPDAPLKPSGVEWLGDVPAHWEVRRLRSVAKIVSGATPASNTPEYWDGDIVWLTPEDLGRLTSRRIDSSARRLTNDGYKSCGTTIAPIGSIALSTRAPIGHIGILDIPACVNQGCRLLVPMKAIQSNYLYYALEVARDDLVSLGQGSTFTELSRSKLGGFALPLPPLAEQTAIVEHLDRATADIDAAIARTRREIELVREYHTRLTADVVTGKLDVREAAAQLPDEAGEAESS